MKEPAKIVESKEEALQRALTKTVKAKEDLEREFAYIKKQADTLTGDITTCRRNNEMLERELRIHQDYQRIFSRLIGGRF